MGSNDFYGFPSGVWTCLSRDFCQNFEKNFFLTQLKRFRRKSLNGGHYTSWNRDRAQFGQPGQIDRLRLSYKFYFNVHNEIIFLWTGNLPKVGPIKTISESGIFTSDQFSENWKVFRRIQNPIFDSCYLEKRTSFQESLFKIMFDFNHTMILFYFDHLTNSS